MSFSFISQSSNREEIVEDAFGCNTKLDRYGNGYMPGFITPFSNSYRLHLEAAAIEIAVAPSLLLICAIQHAFFLPINLGRVVKNAVHGNFKQAGDDFINAFDDIVLVAYGSIGFALKLASCLVALLTRTIATLAATLFAVSKSLMSMLTTKKNEDIPASHNQTSQKNPIFLPDEDEDSVSPSARQASL